MFERSQMIFLSELQFLIIGMMLTLLLYCSMKPTMVTTLSKTNFQGKHFNAIEIYSKQKLPAVGETGVGWDRGWLGQRGFEYVPDN